MSRARNFPMTLILKSGFRIFYNYSARSEKNERQQSKILIRQMILPRMRNYSWKKRSQKPHRDTVAVLLQQYVSSLLALLVTKLTNILKPLESVV